MGWGLHRRPLTCRCSASDASSCGDALPQKYDRLQRENEQFRRRLADRDKQIAEQQQQLEEQKEQIVDLQRQLSAHQKDSSNSSKPPSSDGLRKSTAARLCRHRSKRRPGGQKGHPGHHRRLVLPAEVQRVVPVLPPNCQHCGHELPQQLEDVQTTGDAHRHQVTELPSIQPYVIEYQCHKVQCPICGEATRAALPSEAQGHFGPQLTALIAYLTVVCRMPRRVTESFFEQALNI